jgi:hypothetical protein
MNFLKFFGFFRWGRKEYYYSVIEYPIFLNGKIGFLPTKSDFLPKNRFYTKKSDFYQINWIFSHFFFKYSGIRVFEYPPILNIRILAITEYSFQLCI